jgi:GNAT superfamily N-acetyltransferase
MTAGSMERTLQGPLRAGPGSGLIRTGGPADADRIRDFVCALSPRSQYFRFFASVSPPSTGLLRALSGATGSADILLLTDSRGAIIGHGMAADARTADGHLEANIGLAIADNWQQCGLGTTLLSVLVSRAAQRGVRALVLDVLPDNDRMRAVIRRRWPDAPSARTKDALIFRPPIGPADVAGTAIAGPLPALIRLCNGHAGHPVTTSSGGRSAPARSAA